MVHAGVKTWLWRSHRQAGWAPWLVFIFYAVAAKGFNAYILYPSLDMPTHFFGGAAIAYFFLSAATNVQALTGAIPKSIRLLLALGMTAFVAVVWEFLEYASDILLGTKMNLGVADTLSDLFFGLLGATVVLVVAVLFQARSAR